MKTKLHHIAYNITPNSLELILELFKIFDVKLVYIKNGARWCMISQKSININIQLIETNVKPILIEKKINTHIAFISDDPEKNVNEIKQWANVHKIKFIKGEWSNKELWFDLPELFVNFVIEIMHKSVIE